MNLIEQIKGGLIVSCQALENEPLHSSFIMARMAKAAKLGGAAGIRTNSVKDICRIKKTVSLPVIGIVKKEYADSLVYITPTMKEVDALVKCKCEIIAIDATNRLRPNGETLELFFAKVRKKYPNQLFMADCATYKEGMNASSLGFDLIGTTLCGYTDESKNDIVPNYDLMSALVRDTGKPVIAEGNIWTPEQLQLAVKCGIHAAVVGSAITRPMLITRRFADSMKRG
jgi:N-acylglucosamine-6-phosphate 2-epimerase